MRATRTEVTRVVCANQMTACEAKAYQWQVRDTRNNALVAGFDTEADASYEASRLNHLAYVQHRYIAVTADLAK